MDTQKGVHIHRINDLLALGFFVAIICSIIFYAGEYSFIYNYMSDLGQIYVNGNPNIISLTLFSIAALFQAFNGIYLGKKLWLTQNSSKIFQISAILFIISAVSLTLLLFFPKDVNYDMHLYISLGIYIGYIPGIIFFNMGCYRTKKGTLFTYAIGGVVLILFALYVFANFVSLPPGLFQKLSIFSLVIATLTYFHTYKLTENIFL